MSKPKIFSSIEGVEFYKVKKYSNSNKEKIKGKKEMFLLFFIFPEPAAGSEQKRNGSVIQHNFFT